MRKLFAFQALVLIPVCLWAQNPGSAAAVSSEAATVQPKNPARLTVPTPTPAPSKPTPTLPQTSETMIDPLLDPTRPKNCQLEISNEQLSKNFRGTMRACIVNVIQVSNSVSLFLEHGEIKQPNIFASKKPENLCDLVRILVDH